MDISKDYFHENPILQQQAINVLNSFQNKGAIPLLTWHHIEELISHKNEGLVLNSLKLLIRFPVVAFLKSQGAPFHIGSIIDIETIELNFIIDDKNISLKKIIQKTRNKIFDFSSGKELIEPYIHNIETLREFVLSRENRKREIASIARARSIKPQEAKLSTLRNGKFRSLGSAKNILNKMHDQLEDEICQKGDKKIVSPEATANDFVKDILRSGKAMLNSSGSLEKRFLEEYGITVEETKNFKTFEQVQYLSIFKKRLEIISRNFADNMKEKIYEINQKKCPTWLLWKELHKIRTKADRASGSDLNDGCLAGLIYYADLTIVDKRTNEYLSQIKRKCKHIEPLMNKFEKLSQYSKILTFLPEK